MLTTNKKLTSVQEERPDSIDVYRTVWRWHFYAGLLVLPFLILLAVTGGLYLFHAEIDNLVHRDLKTVTASTQAPLLHQRIVDKALALHPGTVFKYTPPSTPTTSAEVSIQTTAGDKLVVYVDPHRGQVLGQLPDRGTIVWTIRKLHSLKYFGSIASGMIEIAGGWTILLVITGIYLWWPRKQGGGVISVRGKPQQRIFWRDVHAVIGIFAGCFILFLAMTGMPWSVLWGAKVNQWANGNNFGYPTGVRVSIPMSDEHLNHIAPVTWSLEQARIPESVSGGHTPIGLDAAVAIFEKLGLAKGYAVNPPSGLSGVYTGSVYPSDLAQQRVIHLDQFTGKALIDMGYADYGPLGKGLEWGINVHLGQEFGLANKLLMLAVCFAIVLLCISAAAMWWKRRPNGSLGVPPLPADPAKVRTVFGLLLIGGIIFPLVGASMLVMLVADTLYAKTKVGISRA